MDTAGKKRKGIIENPMYNDLPMSDIHQDIPSSEQPGYHEIKNEGERGEKDLSSCFSGII